MMSASHHLASWCWGHGLAGAETAGDGRRARPLASGNIVSMTRWPVMSGRGEVMRAAGRARRADGPALAQREGVLGAFGVGDFGDGVVDGVRPVFGRPGHGAFAQQRAEQAAVGDGRGLGAGGVDAAGRERIAGLDGPASRPQRFCLVPAGVSCAPRWDKSCPYRLRWQAAGRWMAVVDVAQDAGAQRGPTTGRPVGFHRLACFQAAGLLVGPGWWPG